MNNHRFMIYWISVMTQEPAIETYETLDEANAALDSFRKHYPGNCYFLYTLLK